MIDLTGIGRKLSAAACGFLAVATAATVLGADGAAAYSSRVRKACRTDFHKFCPSYKEDTPALRTCMRANGGGLSSHCIDALMDSGLLTRSEIKEYKAARGK